MKAIITKWECPSCGNVMEKRQTLITNQKSSKYSFIEPERCDCGRKSSFKLIAFESATAIIKADSEE